MLNQIYQNTGGGDTWTQGDNWNFFNASSSYCEWEGVTCDCLDTDIISLNISGFGATGRFPMRQLRRLNTKLEVLDVSNNNFNSMFPFGFRTFKDLQVLNMANNEIWGYMNIGLSLMRKLKVLDLSNNCLQGKIPQALGSLNHLEEVYFQGNEKLESGMANTLCWRHSAWAINDLAKIIDTTAASIGQGFSNFFIFNASLLDAFIQLSESADLHTVMGDCFIGNCTTLALDPGPCACQCCAEGWVP
eukprot:CAMPEP_0178970740 /NCGR_PEP_ID=MMETSP0789-20121207/19785_1 /TAXON_ID=3005 /ORGANISM="Rhizosolenia setigera, Strain CCMP 1694" /LENGTH=245 /DNA_ID=CAMNT_0020657429 /DNA_START=173 /DNA_END=906 /DNA_ORIENTATION=-